MKFHTIQIDLEPDADPEMIGQEYRAIVMAHELGTQHNTGCVVRSDSPEKAFTLCLQTWRNNHGS